MRRAHRGRRWYWPSSLGMWELVPAYLLTPICTRSYPGLRCTSVPPLSASPMGGLFIEHLDTGNGLSKAHFHHEATACWNSGYTARKNLPSSRTRRNSGSFPLTGSRCWNSISVYCTPVCPARAETRRLDSPTGIT